MKITIITPILLTAMCLFGVDAEPIRLGAPRIPISEKIDCADVGPHDYEIERVARLETFKPLSEFSLPEEGNESVFWLRFTIVNPSERTIGYQVVLRKGGFWRANLSYRDDTGFVQKAHSYNVLREEFGPNSVSPNASLSIEVDAQSAKTVYVKLRAYYVDRLIPMLVRNDVYRRHSFLLSITFGTVFGILVGLFFFNSAVLSSIAREVSILYIPYHLFVLLYVAFANGVLTSFAEGLSFSYLRFNLLASITALMWGFMILFTRKFYDIHSLNRLLDRGLLFATIGSFGLGTLLLIEADFSASVSTIVSPFLVGVTVCMIVATGIILFVHKSQYRYPYALAWSCFITGTLIAYLRDYGIMAKATPYLSLKGDQIGVVCFVAFTSIAVVERVKIERREREQMRLVAERARSKVREIESIARAKADFMTNVSHDLRTPVTNIKLSIESLSEASTLRNNKPTSDIAGDMLKQTDLLIRRIDNLLTFSRLDTPIQNLYSEPMDPMLLLRDIVGRFHRIAENKGITFRFEERDASGALAMMNEEMLDSIVSNLLDNAIRYTDTGGTVSVTLDKTETAVMIEVEDTGCGIEPARINTIFDRYVGDNTGVGLALVMAFTERLGGKVDVSSTPGRGSQFIVSFPLVDPFEQSPRTIDTHPDAAVAEYEEEKTTDSMSNPASGFPVVIVEDDPMLLTHLTEVLENEFAVAGFSTVREAIEFIDTEPPGLIITDIMLPGMSGIEFLRMLKEDSRYSEAPRLILTAKRDAPTEQEAFDLGAMDIIYKPFSRHTLVRKVRNMLDYRVHVRQAVEDGLIRHIRGWESTRFSPLDRRAPVAVPHRDNAVSADVTGERRVPDNGKKAITWKAEFGLTDQQERVLALVVKGYTNQEIADMLALSRRTIENHVSRLLDKFDVDRRTQLTYDVLERE